ncbi:alpha-hydroxy acid oxidase [Actinokineospora sp. NPDC004072]
MELADFAASAQSALNQHVWDYISGGAGCEWALRANEAAFQRLTLRPRVLVDASACDTGTSLLGAELPAPIGIAPMAYHRLLTPEGELATAAAADGLLFVVSIFASADVAEIAKAATGPLWMQLYWLRQRAALLDLVARVEDAGYGALVLTVDAPRVARRPRDVRNGFTVPEGIRAVNLDAAVMAASHRAEAGTSAIERHSREQFDPTITWADLAWLRSRTRLPLVLKGILTAEDAELAVANGVDAIVVSNHGGRQLDAAPATLDVLPEIAERVAGRIPVLLDGGVRSGADVAKAIALGAATVLVGRPVLWGLAHSGADGAAAVLGLLRAELAECLALCGRPALGAVDGSMIRPSPR